MKEVLDKITSYHLFNYLLPGVLFVVILEKLTTYSVTQENLVVGAFVYYFVGLVVSRFGSLILEPLLKKISFLKFADYKDFIVASKQDMKIEELSEANNMYRTFVSMFILLAILKFYEILAIRFPLLNTWGLCILITVLLIMFLFSYRKQTQYITKRISSYKS